MNLIDEQNKNYHKLSILHQNIRSINNEDNEIAMLLIY